MKKKFYSLLLLLATVLTAHAADAKWCLVVESAAGETIAIGADQKPVIKTVADGYELRYGETVTAFTWSELKKVTVKETEPTPTAIGEVKGEALKPFLRVAPGEIAIEGAEPGSTAQVYSVKGQLVQSAHVGENGTVELSTAGLPANIYIIKTTKSSFKLVKK